MRSKTVFKCVEKLTLHNGKCMKDCTVALFLKQTKKTPKPHNISNTFHFEKNI